MRFIVYLMAILMVGTAVAQNPTILQGNYISNVFGQANFVLNPNAQTSIANVTNATRSITTPLVATSEFTLNLTNGQFATWTLRAFDSGMKGQNCEARFTYRGFATATTKAELVQNSLVVASLTLTPSTDPRIASINFPCGDLVNATTFRIAQTTANMTTVTPNEIGGIYVGLATNQANVAQAETVVIASGANQTITNTGTFQTVIYTSESSDVYGEYNTSTGVFTAKRAGRYLIDAAMIWDTTTWAAGDSIEIRVYKGTTAQISQFQEFESATAQYRSMQINGIIDVAVGETITIAVTHSSGTNKSILNSSLYNYFHISRFPTSSELVVTPERQNVWGGVVYTGNNNQSLFNGTAASTTYTTYNSASWTSARTLKGKCSAPVIGDDVGCQIPNMPVGNYEISFTGLHYITVNSSGFVTCSLKIRETTTSSDVGYGTERAIYSALATAPTYKAATFSGVFTNSSVANRNFVIQSAKTLDNTTSNAGACSLFVGTTGGDLTNITITVTPLDQPSNSALYVQGPVKASATGDAIPSGYQMEGITRIFSTLTSQSSGGWKTGTGVTLQPGVYFVDAFTNIATVAPTRFNCALTKTVNGGDINDDRSFPTLTEITEQGNTLNAKPCKTYGYFRVTSSTTFYPTVYVFTPVSSSYSFDFYISAIRLN